MAGFVETSSSNPSLYKILNDLTLKNEIQQAEIISLNMRISNMEMKVNTLKNTFLLNSF
jgi:hypothetical protein